jgi:subtilase family serine protease
MLDVSDPVLDGTRSVLPLASGATSTGSTTLTIPANTPAGTYYLLAKADAGSTVTETVETNNSMSRTIQVGPDLRVSAFAAPASVAAGGSVSVTDTAVNQGGAPAGASTTRYFLSANLTLDAGDVYLAERAVPGLAVNQSNSAATALQVPAGTAAGSYYLLAQADGAGAVGESLETNNVTPKAIQVTMVP